MTSIIVKQLAGAIFYMTIFSAVLATIIAFTTSVYGAGIFLIYSLLFTLYFLVIGILATLYTEDMPIRSGRIMAWWGIPFLTTYWLCSFLIPMKGLQLIVHLLFWGGFTMFFLCILKNYLGYLQTWVADIVQVNESQICEWFYLLSFTYII